jgi:hypothetical protein
MMMSLLFLVLAKCAYASLPCAENGSYIVKLEVSNSATSNHHYLDYERCTSHRNHDIISKTSPVQDTYYCPDQIKGLWRDSDPKPRLHYKPLDASCLAKLNPNTGMLLSVEKSFENSGNSIDGISKCIAPNTVFVILGDSIMRQLFTSLDCRLLALGVVKERKVLLTYAVPRKGLPNGYRECHVRITLTNSAVIEYYYTTVPGSRLSSFSPESVLREIPAIRGADVVLLNMASAHFSESYYLNLLNSDILVTARRIWQLVISARVLLQSAAPLGDSPKECGKGRYQACATSTLVHRDPKVLQAERLAVERANATLLNLDRLYSSSSRAVTWPNGSTSALTGFWYCDRQHASITSGLLDTEADLLWSHLCDQAQHHQQQQQQHEYE